MAYILVSLSASLYEAEHPTKFVFSQDRPNWVYTCGVIVVFIFTIFNKLISSQTNAWKWKCIQHHHSPGFFLVWWYRALSHRIAVYHWSAAFFSLHSNLLQQDQPRPTKSVFHVRLLVIGCYFLICGHIGCVILVTLLALIHGLICFLIFPTMMKSSSKTIWFPTGNFQGLD